MAIIVQERVRGFLLSQPEVIFTFTLIVLQSRFGDKAVNFLSNLSPKRECSPKRVNLSRTLYRQQFTATYTSRTHWPYSSKQPRSPHRLDQAWTYHMEMWTGVCAVRLSYTNLRGFLLFFLWIRDCRIFVQKSARTHGPIIEQPGGVSGLRGNSTNPFHCAEKDMHRRKSQRPLPTPASRHIAHSATSPSIATSPSPTPPFLLAS